MKVLPHRLRDGRCRDCGTFDASSSPDTCTRCSLEIMGNLGYQVAEAPQRLWQVYERELWRVAGTDQVSGKLRSDRFHAYVGINDGAPLEPPEGPIPGAWIQGSRNAARLLSEQLQDRYPQVWVVTTVGSWNAVRTQ